MVETVSFRRWVEEKNMKFPVVGKGASIWGENECPVCGKPMVTKEKVEQVVLTVGALRKVGHDAYTSQGNEGLAGIMTVGTHTHGKSLMSCGRVEVVDLSANGQADIAVCSPWCLRVFFGAIVDKLEIGMAE